MCYAIILMWRQNGAINGCVACQWWSVWSYCVCAGCADPLLSSLSPLSLPSLLLSPLSLYLSLKYTSDHCCIWEVLLCDDVLPCCCCCYIVVDVTTGGWLAGCEKKAGLLPLSPAALSPASLHLSCSLSLLTCFFASMVVVMIVDGGTLRCLFFNACGW